MGKLQVVVGGQYGSEGKGAVTAYLARDLSHRDTVIRVAGPNAGHSAYDKAGIQKWALRQVPIAAVVNRDVRLGIAAGSEVDLDVLGQEIGSLDANGHGVWKRLWVHPSATVISGGDKAQEAGANLVDRIGSTGKGIGAARASRAMRNASTVSDAVAYLGETSLPVGWPTNLLIGDRQVIIEGTQGYGLGLHTDNYPQVTSSDCRAIDFLAMAGISPWDADVTELEVWVVARCFPIRVAGNSGPLEDETTWEALGLPEERTTVTQKIRRVGQWDPSLVFDAVAANGGAPTARIALTMLDQMFPAVAGLTTEDAIRTTSPDAVRFIQSVEDATNAWVGLVGTSDKTLVPWGFNA